MRFSDRYSVPEPPYMGYVAVVARPPMYVYVPGNALAKFVYTAMRPPAPAPPSYVTDAPPPTVITPYQLNRYASVRKMLPPLPPSVP